MLIVLREVPPQHSVKLVTTSTAQEMMMSVTVFSVLLEVTVTAAETVNPMGYVVQGGIAQVDKIQICPLDLIAL